MRHRMRWGTTGALFTHSLCCDSRTTMPAWLCFVLMTRLPRGLTVGCSLPGFQTLRRYAAFGCDGCMRSEEHTSELQSLMRNSYAVFCLKKKTKVITQ